MQSWRDISHQAKDLLTVCLANAIDEALSDRLGSNWFADFSLEEQKEKPNTRITKPGQTNVGDWDLQALLKFLRFRSALTEQVLTYHGFFQKLDGFSTVDQLRQLSDLLDRLINDFRNRIEAHTRASDIEKELSGQGMDRIYGYEEAYKDMVKLARVFRNVKDTNGISFHQRITALTGQKKKIMTLIAGAGAAVVVLIAVLLIWLVPDRQEKPTETPVISVELVDAYYENNTLVAICELTNETKQTASYICVDKLSVVVDENVIASAGFGPLEGATLPRRGSVLWKFRFPQDTILDPDADLDDATKLTYDIRSNA